MTMTTLQKQLAAIAATSTHELDLKAQKSAYSKSLLFEPRVAGSQSLETLFQICYEGFRELCTIDSGFCLFERSIFSTQSLHEDRTQLSAKENSELDEVLESFLQLISARILLRPALKALEWLVRRFSIHVYNTEYMILTFLPYHYTEIFITVLSILPKQLPATFKFLHPYMHGLMHPPRNVLVHAAINNANFLSSFNEYVLRASKAKHHSTRLLTFWASICTQTVDGILNNISGRQGIRQQREEDLLTRLLPIIDEALAIKKVPELALGCYMIITVMASKADLDEKTLNAMMLAIVSNWSTDAVDAGLSSITVLAHHKRSPTLPKPIYRAIFRLTDFEVRYNALAIHYPVQNLTLGLALAAVECLGEKDNDRTNTFIHTALTGWHLDRPQKSGLLRVLFKLMRKAWDEDKTTDDVEQQEARRSDFQNIVNVISQVTHMQEVIQELVEEDVINRKILHDWLKIRPSLDSRSSRTDVIEAYESNSDDYSHLDHASPLVMPSLAGVQASSFLSEPIPPGFEELITPYLRCVDSAQNLTWFQRLPILRRDQALEMPQYLSWFLRIACDSKSISARCAALNVLVQYLEGLPSNNTDFQAFIPFAVLCLSSPSGKVRRSASELLATLLQSSEKSGSQSTKITVWGSTDLYGDRTSSIKWLSIKDSRIFLEKVLQPALEESISDAGHIAQALATSLGGPAQSAQLSTKSSSRPNVSQRVAIFSFLCDHVALFPSNTPRLQLLSLLNQTKRVANSPRSKFLMPALKQWISVTQTDFDILSEVEDINVDDLDAQHLAIVRADDEDAMSYLRSLAMESNGNLRTGVRLAAYHRLEVLWPHLKDAQRKSLAIEFLQLSVSESSQGTSSVHSGEALSLLQRVKLTSKILAALIDEIIKDFVSDAQIPVAKRRRVDVSGNKAQDIQSRDDFRSAISRLTIVLDIIDDSNLDPEVELVQNLFKVLQAVQNYKAHSASDLGYLQVLATSNLSSMLGSMPGSSIAKLDPSLVRTDLLVDYVRKSSNPQIRNSAMLLLGAFARYAPQATLLSIMPIFTFMTTTTLQQSDEYSAHVVDETIREVIPLLAKTLRQQNKDLVSAVAEILQSFAAAFRHIPTHRRLRLFSLLASSLGPTECLYAVIATLIDCFPNDAEVDRFASALLDQFSAIEGITSVKKYLDLILDGLESQPVLSKVLLVRKVDGIDSIASQAGLLRAVPSLLKNQKFKVKIAQALKDDTEFAGPSRSLLSDVVERIIRVSRYSIDLHRLLIPCQTALESLLGLLPFDVFADSIEPLLEHEEEGIGRSALKILESRVELRKVGDKKSQLAIIRLLPRLICILEDCSSMFLKRGAIACIDQISEKFGKLDPEAVLRAASVVAAENVLDSNDHLLPILSLHCLASMVEIVQNDFIPLVQPTFRTTCRRLRTILSDGSTNEKYHNAAYSFFTSLFAHIPFMIPEKALREVIEVSHKSAALEISEEATHSRRHALKLAARQLDPKMLVACLTNTLLSALGAGHWAVHEHLDTIRTAIDNQSKHAVTKNVQALFEFFLGLFDLRRLSSEPGYEGKYGDSQTNHLESSAIEVAVAMVLKINDAAFRPLFVRLVAWPTMGSDTRGSCSRSITLFNFIWTLSERLKSIFTSYFGYVLEPSAHILHSAMPGLSKEQILKTFVLQALSSSFGHDQDDFWQTTSHFDVIMQPLVSQLDSPTMVQHENLVILSIVGLATAAASSDHHKAMNGMLLKLAMSESPKTRLAAVKCNRSLTESLGDDWLNQLPEILPVINELQEDDDEEVEKETLRWIRQIEDILGESLDSMLQ